MIKNKCVYMPTILPLPDNYDPISWLKLQVQSKAGIIHAINNLKHNLFFFAITNDKKTKEWMKLDTIKTLKVYIDEINKCNFDYLEFINFKNFVFEWYDKLNKHETIKFKFNKKTGKIYIKK